jgi:glycosyltransferase involved in cell wall biosynthesis
LNVLHLNQSDIGGGAAIAAYRLHQGLRRTGVDSRLLVPGAKLKEETTTVLAPMSLAERALFKLTFKLAPNNTNLLRSWKILKMPAYQKADIIHLHNLHTGLYFNYLTIPRITREKPVVFTLHDMWGFTGHCAYSYECERWRQGCGRCPHPETYPAVQWDNTAIEHYLKKRAYAKSRLVVVTPSRWLSQLAQKSILGRFPIHTIPYGIDTDVYRPVDKADARRQLGLPPEKVIIMFGCADLNDSRKGMDFLLRVLENLPVGIKDEIVLYAMGREFSSWPKIPGIRTMHAGYVESDEAKVKCYSAADIFVSTARADNLPLVLQESLACGTPLLSTDVGGVSDLVRDDITGFTVPVGDVNKMIGSLVELVQNIGLRQKMAMQCRRIAVEEYGLVAMARKYECLYESLLRSGSGGTL